MRDAGDGVPYGFYRSCLHAGGYYPPLQPSIISAPCGAGAETGNANKKWEPPKWAAPGVFSKD